MTARANELHQGSTETDFTLSALHVTSLRPTIEATPRNAKPLKPPVPFELTISGTQLLLALATALALTTLLLWVVVHYWILGD